MASPLETPGKTSPPPPRTSSLSPSWAILGIVYLAMSALLLFRPEGVFYLVNFFPRVLPYFSELPPPSEYYTIVLGAGFFFTHSLLCFGIAFHPRDHVAPLVLFAAKVATSAAFVFAFFHQERTFAFIAGAVLELAIALLLTFRLAKKPFRKKAP